MRTIGQAILAAAVLLAVLATGCGDKCNDEAPQVDSLADCFAPAGQPVSYRLRLCPTCNQNLTGCDVQTDANASGGTFHLNPVVESCEGGASCGPSCQTDPTVCTFTVPAGAAVGTVYQVQAFDGISGTKHGTLTVAEAYSCVFP